MKKRVQRLQDRLEETIAALGSASYRHPWVVVLSVAAMVGGLALQIPQLEVVTQTDQYLDPSDPIRIDYDAFRQQFGHDDIVMVALQPADVFDSRFLVQLRTLHERLEEEVPHVDEVQSLINARRTRGEGDTLIVDELLEEWPEDEAALAELREAVLANSNYRDLFISSDGRTTAVIVRAQAYESSEGAGLLAGFEDDAAVPEEEPEFLSSDSQRELVDAVRSVVADTLPAGIPVAVAGNPVVLASTQAYMFRDMGRFTALALVALASLLGLTLRRASGVVVPIVVVVLTLSSTIGMMAATGRPITFITQVIPSFVLAVGVGFSVHVLAIFFQRLDLGDEEHEAIVHALRHSGPAIAMSAVTTAGGMFSFLASSLLPVRDLGIFIPFGVLLASTLALTLVPALLRLLRVRPRKLAEYSGVPPTERVLEACARFGVRHARAVTLACVPLLLFMLAGIPRISRDFNPIEWLPEDEPARVATDFIDRYMGGATNLELVIDAREVNALHDPPTLRRIEAIQRYVEIVAGGQISKTMSLADVSKEIHQALNGGDPDRYAIPDTRLLLAQEMLLFESAGSDDLEDFTDTGFQLARITLKGKQENTSRYSAFLEKHRPEFERLANGRDVVMTGSMVIGTHIADLTVVTALRSYALAFTLITPLMILFIGRLRIGLVSIVPNLAPILMILGFMGWTGIPLDVFTVLVAGIALGLVVDDTLHILNGFRRDYLESGDVEQAIVKTMRTTGRALLFTTLGLTTAFAIYGFSGALSIKNFGLLTALAIALAFVFDLFLSPALLALVYGKKEHVKAIS